MYCLENVYQQERFRSIDYLAVKINHFGSSLHITINDLVCIDCPAPKEENHCNLNQSEISPKSKLNTFQKKSKGLVGTNDRDQVIDIEIESIDSSPNESRMNFEVPASQIEIHRPISVAK